MTWRRSRAAHESHHGMPQTRGSGGETSGNRIKEIPSAEGMGSVEGHFSAHLRSSRLIFSSILSPNSAHSLSS